MDLSGLIGWLKTFLGAMLPFESGPLFNRFVETSAIDLQHRQAMPKHAFIASESF